MKRLEFMVQCSVLRGRIQGLGQGDGRANLWYSIAYPLQK